MTLFEMSEKVYQSDLEQFRARMRELKEALKAETDVRQIERLRTRIRELAAIVQQTKTMMEITRYYYGPGSHRERRYEAFRFY